MDLTIIKKIDLVFADAGLSFRLSVQQAAETIAR
jgi:hypothetical protein